MIEELKNKIQNKIEKNLKMIIDKKYIIETNFNYPTIQTKISFENQEQKSYWKIVYSISNRWYELESKAEKLYKEQWVAAPVMITGDTINLILQTMDDVINNYLNLNEPELDLSV